MTVAFNNTKSVLKFAPAAGLLMEETPGPVRSTINSVETDRFTNPELSLAITDTL